MVFRAVKKVHDQLMASPFPTLPLIFSEYNASYANEPNVTDSIYMGPWLANNIRLCDGLTESMAYWAFSDVFEEQGVVRSPFYGGFGLIAADNIPKPVTQRLHRAAQARRPPHRHNLRVRTHHQDRQRQARPRTLGLLPRPTASATSTPRPPPARPKVLRPRRSKNVPSNASVEVLRIDADHGNVLKAFDAMGRPAGTLTQAQIKQLRAAGQMSPARASASQPRAASCIWKSPKHGLAVVLIGE